MAYIPFTNEQLIRANTVDLVEFLRFKGEKLESASEEGGAGYRAKGGKPTALEIASLVLAVFGVYLGKILGIVLGVVATVLGAKARRDNQTTLATCGFVLGAVAVVVSVLGILF